MHPPAAGSVVTAQQASILDKISQHIDISNRLANSAFPFSEDGVLNREILVLRSSDNFRISWFLFEFDGHRGRRMRFFFDCLVFDRELYFYWKRGLLLSERVGMRLFPVEGE